MAAFDFGAFPNLRTARLDLIEFDTEFLKDIFAVRSDPIVQLYNSEPHKTDNDTLRFIAEQRAKYSRQEEITWALSLRDRSRVVGCVTVFDWNRYHRCAQAGYDLARDQWGTGLAHEALRAVMRFAFEEMELNRLEIWTSAANERSLRLARRLGFTLDGRLRKRILEDDGQFHDGAVFGLLQKEWSTLD